MTTGKMLQKINTNLGYNFEPSDMGFYMLTRTRYTQIQTIPAAYYCDPTGKEIYKMTIQKITPGKLPNKEYAQLLKLRENIQLEKDEE